MAADLEWAVPGYTHVRDLGAGASGRVVLATDDRTGHPVAIKYLAARLRGDPEFAARFRAEARLLAGLRDPNIVRFLGYVEDPRGAAIVMEVVDGVSLRRVLDDGRALGPEAALVLLKGSLLGLSAAHAAGVVHRDYKPENILVAGDGASKLTDFGIAVRSGAAAPPEGTPAYMAPEQWTGAPVTPAADVYAATAVFYECLTGTRPYSGTLPELAEAHRHTPVPLDAVPVPLRLMVAHGMAKDPAGRPASADALLSELHTVAVPVYGPDWERTGRRRLAVLAGFLGALFPLVGLTELVPGGSIPPPPPAPPGGAAAPPPPGPGAAAVSAPPSATVSAPRRLLRPRVWVPAVVVVVLALAGTALFVLRPAARQQPRPRPTVAAPSVPATPPPRPGDVIVVVRRQMAAKKTAAFTYADAACCGQELTVTGGRLAVPGAGALDAARMVNPTSVPDAGMRTPAHVVVVGTRAWVNLHGAWTPFTKAGLGRAARDPRAQYAKSGMDVLDEARLTDLAAILADAKPAHLTRPGGGAIVYRGTVRASRRLLKRLDIPARFNLPVVLTYHLRLGPDYLPRYVSLKTTLTAGTPSAVSATHRITYASWGTARPVTPPA